MRIGSLFSGMGGLDLAVENVFGGTVAWHCETEPAACRVLAHRWPGVPNLGDITAVDWARVEPVDVLIGGPPCQDVSFAGARAGLRPGTRSGLWSHMAYAINVLRPRLVVIENVRGLLSASAHSDVEPCPWCMGDGEGEPVLRALGGVVGDLASIGYVGQWRGLRAADVGAPHERFRVFVAAWRLGDGDRGDADPDATQLGCRSTGRDDGLRASGLVPVPVTAANANHRAGHGERARTEPRRGVPTAPRSGPEGTSGIEWGPYAPAIARWELILGRAAPAPTQGGRRGGQQLSPWFVEWLMGLPEGHVTAVPGLSRNEQLKLLGNGVVPQQAVAALSRIW